jgi:hypothetical protein
VTNCSIYSKYEWKKRVSQSFDNISVKELITSFFVDGYSVSLTAGAIGIDPDTLRRYCKLSNITLPIRANLRDECKPKPLKKGIIRNPWGVKGKPV